MIVAFARQGPQHVGQFALGLAITAPILLFTNLHLRTVQATDARATFTFNDYLGLRVLSSAGAILAVVAIALLAGFKSGSILAVVAVGVAKVIESISDIYHGLFQRHEQMSRIAWSNFLRGAAALPVMATLLRLTDSVFAAVLGMACVWLTVLVAVDIPGGAKVLAVDLWSAIRPRWHRRELMQLWWVALPVGVVASVIALEQSVPRYVIVGSLGERELGLFAAIAYVLVAANTVVSAIHQAIAPRLANDYAAGDAGAFRRLALRIITYGVGWGCLGVVITVLAGEQILVLFYGREYGQYHVVFILLMVANAIRFGSLGVGTALRSMHRFWLQTVVHLPGLLVMVTASPLLIRRYGLVGASWAVLLTTVFEAVCYGGLLVRLLRNDRAISIRLAQGA